MERQLMAPGERTAAQIKEDKNADRANMSMGEQVSQMFGKLTQSIIDPIAAIFGPVLKSVTNVMGSLLDTISSLITGVLYVAGAFTQVGVVIAFVVGFVTGFLNQLQSGLDNFSDAVRNLVDKIRPIAEFVMSIFAGIGSVIGKILGFITGLVFDILGGAINGIAWALDMLWKGLTWLGTAIKEFFSPITKIFTELWDALTGFVDWIKSWFHIEPAATKVKERKALSDQVWNEVFGATKGSRAATPDLKPSASVLGAISKTDDSAAKMKQMNEAAFINKNNNSNNVKVNITTNVDGIYGGTNKQTAKTGGS